jgi:drug/metabolite transporter (DMT)-like permease
MKKGYIAIMLAVIPWGLSFLNTKIALQALEPMTLAFFRFLLALVLVGVVGLVTKKDLRIKKEDIKYFLLAGGVGITIYFYFENTGVKYIEPAAASMILAALPIATIFAESIFDKREMNMKLIFSGFVSLVGVLIIISGDLSVDGILAGDGLIGYLMMFAAIGAWIVYSLSTKILFDKYHQFTIVFYQFVFGTVLAIPFVLIESNNFELVTPTTVLNVVLLGVFSSGVGFFAYNYAMKHLGVSKSSLFINFIPVVTIIASYFYYGSLISIKQIIGGVLIVISVLMNKEDKTVETVNDRRSIVE